MKEMEKELTNDDLLDFYKEMESDLLKISEEDARNQEKMRNGSLSTGGIFRMGKGLLYKLGLSGAGTDKSDK